MAAQGKKIFLSYRREDAADVAGRIRDWLVQTRRIDREDIFMDVTAILPGANFMDVIEGAISQCRAVIVVISPSWLQQINSPDASYVRAEAEIALAKGVPVIPVLVGGAKLPGAEQLPEKLRVLTSLNVQPLRHETFDYDMGLVRKALRLGSGHHVGRVVTFAVLLLAVLSLGVLTQVPARADNPLWAALHPATPTTPPTTPETTTHTDTFTEPALTAAEILDRAKSARFTDMEGSLSGSLTTQAGVAGVSGEFSFTYEPSRSYSRQVTTLGSNTFEHYSINDGATSYERDSATDKWRKEVGVGSNGLVGVNDYATLFADDANAVLIGTEFVNGRSTYHTHWTARDNGVDVWVRVDNFYPVKISLTPTGGAASDNIVFTFTSWDIGGNIPIPAADQITS